MNHKQEEQGSPSSEKSQNGFFSLGKGLMLSATITGYIIGPLLVLGGIGFWLDRYFGTKPWVLLASLAIAFFSTNFLIYKRSNEIAKKFIDEKDS